VASLEKPSRSTRRRRLRRPGRPEDAAKGLEQLRQVIVGPEQSRIGDLEERPKVAAETVGGVLPEAIAHATANREQELAIALEPTMTRAMGTVARRRPELFGEILAPTIGAAVRKAVADAFAAVMERFNEALERSLSVRSVHWRLEAARTGRPFAEVCLLHTMRYRVEQVLLIHTETSLVLQHVIEAGQTAEPDQIAAMLAAIDTFGREAFSATPEEHLERFELGGLSVWVSRDPAVTLAAVVRGTAAAEIGRELDEVRERVHLSCRPLLGEFSGDVAPFALIRPELEPLIKMAREPPARRAHLWLGVLAFSLVAAVVGLVLRGAAHRAEDARVRETYVRALESEPGIVVSTAEWSRGHGRFVGLRDPLSSPPEAIFERHGLRPATTVLAPFVSLDPRIEQRRVERVLNPPPGVTAGIDAGTLHVTGQAPRAWIEEARLLGRTLPGVERYDDDALQSTESIEGLRAAAAALEAAHVPFARNQARLLPQQAATVRGVATTTSDAMRLAREAHVGACLEIIGHADPRGDSARNRSLSAERAARVEEELVSYGVDPHGLRARGAGAWDTGGTRARSVTFHLAVQQGSSGASCKEVR